MARKHGVTTKYNPAIAYSSQSIQADMQESKEGRYVELQDYENAIGVIRKLKTKLAKKERRAVKLRKPETVGPIYLTLEEKKAVKVGEKFRISGHWSCKEPRIASIHRLYDRAYGDFGIIVLFDDTGETNTISTTSLHWHEFQMERVV